MGRNTYVYCTNCRWFKITDDVPECKYSTICDIWDFEDSKPISERPKYKPKMKGRELKTNEC